MKASTKIAVLASGGGTNFEAIADAVKAGRLDAEIVAVVSDQPKAAVLEKARARGIRALAIPYEKAAGREAHEEKILEALRDFAPRFLVLAGYMRVLTPRLIEAFRDSKGYSRLVNIHPSLLPAFPGVEGYAQAFRYGVKKAGITVHLVELDVDSGPVCAQETFAVEDCRSEKEVEERGKRIENELYPKVLTWILSEKFHLEKRGRLCVRPI